MRHLVDTYRPITLEQMSGIKLMNRIDTKFVTTVPRLLLLLEMARDSYRIQETAGKRIIPYSTLYFDSEQLDMYTTHHCGHLPRQKARVRSYTDSQLHFLEVKTKDNHRRTRKKRISLSNFIPSSHEARTMTLKPGANTAQRDAFMAHHLKMEASLLLPQLENSFNRITLVNDDRTERLTIDTSLRFHNITTGCDCDLTGLVIIELKRDGRCQSPVLEMLRLLRIKPQGFSKYCMGTALTNPHARANRFKKRLRRVQRLLSEI